MALSTRRRLLDSTALLVALLALLAAQQRHSCAEAAALPLSAVSPAELARLIEAGDQQEMMEMALAASSDPELAERLLSRIWQSIQEQERILQRIGDGGPDFEEIRMTKKKRMAF